MKKIENHNPMILFATGNRELVLSLFIVLSFDETEFIRLWGRIPAFHSVVSRAWTRSSRNSWEFHAFCGLVLVEMVAGWLEGGRIDW